MKIFIYFICLSFLFTAACSKNKYPKKILYENKYFNIEYHLIKLENEQIDSTIVFIPKNRKKKVKKYVIPSYSNINYYNKNNKIYFEKSGLFKSMNTEEDHKDLYNVERYKIIKSDTIKKICLRKYKDPDYYFIVCIYNDFLNPFQLEIGQEILLPSKDELNYVLYCNLDRLFYTEQDKKIMVIDSDQTNKIPYSQYSKPSPTINEVCIGYWGLFFTLNDQQLNISVHAGSTAMMYSHYEHSTLIYKNFQLDTVIVEDE